MKFPALLILLGCALNAAPKTAAADTNTIVFSSTPHKEIPDGSSSGLVDTIFVPDVPGRIVENVSVTLTLDVPAGQTGFTGDFYGYLQHGNDIAILLNRPGKGPTLPAGYDDNISMSITFADGAPNGDIHNYRQIATGSDNIPLTFTLTGMWEPDARATNPDLVTPADPRLAKLAVFGGGDAAGDWALFIADLSSGGQEELSLWSLNLQTIIVPEPSTTALVFLGASAWLIARRRRPRAERPPSNPK